MTTKKKLLVVKVTTAEMRDFKKLAESRHGTLSG
jgi:hypothetical protein